MDGLRIRSILSLMKSPPIQYKSRSTRPDWSWQPARAKKQLEKEMSNKERRT